MFKTKKEKIEIPPINFKRVKVTLEGDSPLLVNRFSEKSKQQILDKQLKKAKTAKEAKDPMTLFKASLYPIPGKRNKYGVPAGGVKKCAVSACKFVDGVPASRAQGSFHILAGPGNLVEIKGGKPQLDEQMVRVGPFGRRVADVRYRARFDTWSLSFIIQYNANMISPGQLVNLFDNAGFAVGLCEYRPEKSGSYGMFHVSRG